MFGRKQKKAIEVTKLSSLIADNLHIVGDVLFTGGLRVDGRVEGNVLGKRGEKSLVVLSDKACIVGRVYAYDAVINGTVTGDLEVEHFLELQPGAKVSGNIAYRQLQMECGATVEGKLIKVADPPAQRRTAAPPPRPGNEEPQTREVPPPGSAGGTVAPGSSSSREPASTEPAAQPPGAPRPSAITDGKSAATPAATVPAAASTGGR